MIASSGISFREVRGALRGLCPQSLLNWREARFYARYGEVELHLLDLLCRRDRDAIDVGANDGSYVHFLRRYCRRVHAFEPMPDIADTLRDKFSGGNVVVHATALSNAAGTTELHMPVVDGVVVTGCSTIAPSASQTYPAHRSISVPMERLDDVYSGTVGFIKIDVEGHEHAVLQGAAETIRRCRPRMLVEVDERLSAGGLARIKAYFTALAYSGHYVHDGTLRPVAEFSPSRLQDPSNLPDLTAPLQQRQRFGRYIYNFVFLPVEEAPALAARINARLATL